MDARGAAHMLLLGKPHKRLTDNASATGQARKHMHKQLLRVKSGVLQKATLGIRTRRQNWASEWGT